MKTARRDFVLVFIINLLISISFHILNPTLPKYVVALGMNTGMAGLISTAFVITSLAVRPFSGRWCTHGNLLGLLRLGLGFLLMAMVGYGFSHSMPTLVVCRLLHGLGWGLSTTATATIAAAVLPEKRLGSGIGIFGLASCISNAVAPNLGLMLTANGSYASMFAVTACLPVACLALSLGVSLPQPAPRKPQTHRLQLSDFFSMRCLAPLGMILLLSVSVASVSNFLVLHAEEQQVAGVGLFFTVYAVTLFFSKPMSGRAADGLGFGVVIYSCLALMAAAFVLISIGGALWVFLLAAALYGVGYGGLQPTLQAWSFRLETPERRGVASSTFFIGLDAGTGIGASMAGLAAQHMGYRQMYLVMLLPLALALLVYVLTIVKQRKESGYGTTA